MKITGIKYWQVDLHCVKADTAGPTATSSTCSTPPSSPSRPMRASPGMRSAAHRARATPEEFPFSATDFNSCGTAAIAAGAPQRVDGFMTALDAPGLGILPHPEVLGRPAGVIQ
jgi:hypothetical protein